MKRMLLSILIGGFYLSFIGCGDRDASITLLPTSMDLKLSADEPKKLQMVIIGDPTKSMIETQAELEKSLPSFTGTLVNTGFNFDIFCTTTNFNGGELTSLQIENYRSPEGFDLNRLSQDIGNCINTTLDDSNEESGLEAAKKAWEKVIASKALDPSAVKLTMIVSNEDDCSVDHSRLGKNQDATCDQSAKPGTSIPMKEKGFADDERLFSTSRYTDFFNKYLTYEDTESDSGLVRKRGHIFAPVIMRPPQDVGSESAYACVDKKAAVASKLYDSKTNIAAYVMSFGQRYFKVAETTGNIPYSLCGNIANILANVHADVESQVSDKTFFLKRRPENPDDLTIVVRRKISDPQKASSIISDMDKTNASLPEKQRWVKKSKTIWQRTLKNGNGFKYLPQTNEIVLNDKLYEPYNDSLSIKKYKPSEFDGETKYGSNEDLN